MSGSRATWRVTARERACGGHFAEDLVGTDVLYVVGQVGDELVGVVTRDHFARLGDSLTSDDYAFGEGWTVEGIYDRASGEGVGHYGAIYATLLAVGDHWRVS